MLLVCAVLFVVIAKLDATAAQHVKDRARAAAVDRAAPIEAAPSRPTATGVALAGGGVVEAPQRNAHAGAGDRHGSSALFLLAAVGALMATAGAALLAVARR